MKYVLVPIFRLLYGVFVFLFAAIALLIGEIVWLFWHFRPLSKEETLDWFKITNYPGFEDRMARAVAHDVGSPLPKYPEYKTALHWIFKIRIPTPFHF